MARSRDTRVGSGDPGGPCKEIAENCAAWRTHVKDDNIVTFSFVVDALWIRVTALREETAIAFAREIIEWLKEDAEREAPKR